MLSQPSPEQLEFLIKRASLGDDDAFDVLLSQYRPLIAGEVHRFLSCGYDRDELNQEAAIGFYHAVRTYRTTQSEVSFGLYAKVCIHNKLLDLARDYKKTLPVAEEDQSQADVTTDPFEILAEQERFRFLWQMICDALSPYENDVLRQYLAGATPEELSRKLGKPVRSVENALFRIRAKLKRLLHF